MNYQEMRKELLDIISEVTNQDNLEHLDDARALKEQLEMDSMDLLDYVMELKRKFQIDIKETDFTKLGTIHDSIDFLSANRSLNP